MQAVNLAFFLASIDLIKGEDESRSSPRSRKELFMLNMQLEGV
jgi:hypothetical protein